MAGEVSKQHEAYVAIARYIDRLCERSEQTGKVQKGAFHFKGRTYRVIAQNGAAEIADSHPFFEFILNLFNLSSYEQRIQMITGTLADKVACYRESTKLRISNSANAEHQLPSLGHPKRYIVTSAGGGSKNGDISSSDSRLVEFKHAISKTREGIKFYYSPVEGSEVHIYRPGKKTPIGGGTEKFCYSIDDGKRVLFQHRRVIKKSPNHFIDETLKNELLKLDSFSKSLCFAHVENRLTIAKYAGHPIEGMQLKLNDFRNISDDLKRAHEEVGVVVRDIKAQNMCRKNGNLYFVDIESLAPADSNALASRGIPTSHKTHCDNFYNEMYAERRNSNKNLAEMQKVNDEYTMLFAIIEATADATLKKVLQEYDGELEGNPFGVGRSANEIIRTGLGAWIAKNVKTEYRNEALLLLQDPSDFYGKFRHTADAKTHLHDMLKFSPKKRRAVKAKISAVAVGDPGSNTTARPALPRKSPRP